MIAHHQLRVPADAPTPVFGGPVLPVSSTDSIVIRPAALLDLDVMVSIAMAAMELDPQWNYRFPHRRNFPNDTWHFTRRRYREFLENKSGRWSVMLAELACPRGRSGASVDRPQTVAFAVWDVAHVTRPALRPTNCTKEPTAAEPTSCRRDANGKRQQAWSQTLGASRKLFDQQFGTNHFQLQLLATDPQFQRIGAGTALCGAGIETAERLKMGISVFASPMGKRLYSRLGFQQLATVTVKVEGEDDFVSVAAMVYQVGGQP